MKKIKSSKALILLLVLLCFFAVVSRPNHAVCAESVIPAKAMCLIDANSSRKLYDKNPSQKLAMASTTKIVTALTVLDNCDNLDEEFEIDKRAVGISGTSIYLKQGEKMTIRELLYGMMLPSGNDAATALAYKIGGDIPTFCDLMQKTANKCGAYNSSFANPHGLDANDHYTTAYDLALITAKALENETFKQIVTTINIKIRGSAPNTYRYLKNKNKLLKTLDGCIGVKTGYTNNAGRCLVSACERDGFRTVCVVLNCGPMFEESSKYINMAYKNFKNVCLLDSYKVIRHIMVKDGKTDYVKTCTKRQFCYPLTNDELSRIEYRYNLPSELIAPVKKDQVIGELQIYLDNRLLFCEKIYTIDSVNKIGVWSSIKDIISQW